MDLVCPVTLVRMRHAGPVYGQWTAGVFWISVDHILSSLGYLN